MTELTLDKNLIGPWVCARIDKAWIPDGKEAIGVVQDGEVLGGIVFEDYTGRCISAHIAIAHPRVPLRKLLVTGVMYAYNQLGVEKILTQVSSNNAASIRFNTKLGFKPEALIKGVFYDGDLLVFSLTKEDCTFLPREQEAA